MPEERPYSSISYEGLEVVPHEAPETFVEQPGLEAIQNHNPVDSEKQAVDPSSPSIAKDAAWREPPTGLKRQWGHSRRFWILVAVGVFVIIAVVIGAAAGTTVGKHHGSTEDAVTSDDPLPTSSIPSSSSTSTVVSTAAPTATAPVQNLALDCPKLDKQGHNSTVTNATVSPTTYYFEYKQFCNATVGSGSPNIVPLITPNPEVNLNSTAASFDLCIDRCSFYNINHTNNTDLMKYGVSCTIAWFDANRTRNPENNCILYASGYDTYTQADLVTPGEPLGAMAVLVSFGTGDDEDSLVDDQYLSDNGDWDI